MRALLVICVATVFHSIFVASRNIKDQIQISTKAQDAECNTDCARLLDEELLDDEILTPVEDDYKRIERASSRNKQCTDTMQRCRKKSKSKKSDKETTKDDKETSQGDKETTNKEDKETVQQTDSVPPVAGIFKEGMFESMFGDTFEGIGISDWMNKNNDAHNNETHDNYPIRGELDSILRKLIEELDKNSTEDNSNVSNSSVIDTFGGEDLCQKWLDNREKIEGVFPGSFANLPACPCLYPSDIFYDNEIWDEKLKKTFQWRDVSHHTERLQIYKPGAVYCVQTLSFQSSESAVTQHCCYDGNKNLLTRGSGAGTPYIISPDISTLLHDKIDLMPWRLCKGDFTRYNEVRKPNNGNDCEINPDDEEYQSQVENAKNY